MPTSNGSEPRVVFTDLGFWVPECKFLRFLDFIFHTLSYKPVTSDTKDNNNKSI